MNKITEFIHKLKSGKGREKVSNLRWIYKQSKAHWVGIVIFTLLGLSGTLIGLLSSLVSRDLVDIITGHQTGKLLLTFLSMLGVTIVSTLISLASSYISTKITTSIENDVKLTLFDEIMTTEWEYLNQFHSGDILIRWQTDAAIVSTGILNVIPNLVIFTFKFFSSLALVWKYDYSFAIIALLSTPISLFISRYSLKIMGKTNMKSMEANASIAAFNQETFSNVQTIKAFDMINNYSKRLKIIQKAYTEARMAHQRAIILNTLIMTVVGMLVSFAAQGWGVYKVWSGAITYGTMTMFIGLSSGLTATLNQLISLIPTTIGVANASARIQGIIEGPKEDYSQYEAVREFAKRNTENGLGVCVRDIGYAYPNAQDKVFSNVEFNAHPHEIIALVGPSGEGKTTMLRFLLSVIRKQEGNGYITVGNNEPENSTDYVELSASTRQLFAYVPQGNTMFSGTIASNLRNVKEDATDEEIIEALKMACAWSFVEKLPEGINSPIGERGSGFSEGQAQRLSIARAILRKSPILLLDEATSALDIKTEREVLKNIMKDEYPRTCIVTTHRPTVLNICDRVYSISDKRCTLMAHDEIEEMIKDF